jgi:hypothetical protein
MRCFAYSRSPAASRASHANASSCRRARRPGHSGRGARTALSASDDTLGFGRELRPKAARRFHRLVGTGSVPLSP